MSDHEVGSFQFNDREDGEGFALVKAYPGQVALVLSLRKNGDIQVVLELADAEKLAQLITRGIEAAT